MSTKKKSAVALNAVASSGPGTGVGDRRAEAAGIRKKLAALAVVLNKKIGERTELTNQLKAIEDSCKHSWSLPVATADSSRVKVTCEKCGMEKLVPRDSVQLKM